METSGVNLKHTENSTLTKGIKDDLYSILQSCAVDSKNKGTTKGIEIVNPAYHNSRYNTVV